MKFTAATAGDLVGRLRAGVSIADAARGAGLSERTVETWLRKGRQDPDGRYGDFARRADAARAEAAERPLTEADLVRLLENAAKRGSVQAIRVLLDRHRRRQATGPPADDAFDELDRGEG